MPRIIPLNTIRNASRIAGEYGTGYVLMTVSSGHMAGGRIFASREPRNTLTPGQPACIIATHDGDTLTILEPGVTAATEDAPAPSACNGDVQWGGR